MFKIILVAVPALSRVDPEMNLRSDEGGDIEVNLFTQQAGAVAGQADGCRSTPASLADGTADIGRAAGCGDADDQVNWPDLQRGDVGGAAVGVVLGSLNGPDQRGRSARDQPDYHSRAEC